MARPDRRVRLSERRMIQHVRRIRAEVEPDILANREAFMHRRVHLLQPRPVDTVPSHVPKGAGGGCLKGRSVEPSIDAPIGKDWARHLVRVPASGLRVAVIDRHGWREWMTALPDIGCRGCPSANHLIHSFTLVEPHLVFSEGQLIDGLRLERIAYIEFRRTIIRSRVKGSL